MNPTLAPVQSAVAEDLPATADLLHGTFANERRQWDLELPWQYLRNPCGPAIYSNAHDEQGRLVGHYAVLPLPRLANPKFEKFQVYLSLNTAVHPDAQGKGLFKTTARAVYDHLEQRGPSIVLGVANAASVNGFIGSLGFYSLGKLSLAFYPPWFRSWTGPERTLSADPAYVAWRAARPGAPFVRDATTRSLIRVVPHKGVSVQGLLTPGLSEDAWQALRDIPVRSRRSRLFDPVLYACSGPAPAGGVPVPDRFRPSPLHYICRVLPDKSAAPLVNSLHQSRFEFLDFDVL